jgi:hypothetical protein
MTGSALIVVIVIVAIALVAVGIGVAMMQRNRLRPLSSEAKARYAESWSAIESRFIEKPAAAVQEADQLVVAIQRDRGARMEDARRLPRELVQARAAARTNEGESGTEGLRKAMLGYQHIVEDALGESMHKPRTSQQREVAS